MNIITEPTFIGFYATDDDTYDGPGSLIGWGLTEDEAEADLAREMELPYVIVIDDIGQIPDVLQRLHREISILKRELQ
jgi:hypothetical protein